MAAEEGEESELEGEARREGVTNPLRVKADIRASEEDRGEGVVSDSVRRPLGLRILAISARISSE